MTKHNNGMAWHSSPNVIASSQTRMLSSIRCTASYR